MTAADTDTHMIIAERGADLAGVAQIGPLGQDADILLLFIDPPFMGQGIGRLLFEWCVEQAAALGAGRLLIDADPKAEAFYLRMGAKRVGQSPSASVPGRLLPQLAYTVSP